MGPAALISCGVFRQVLEPRLPSRIEATWLDYGLHTRPADMRPALQQLLNAFEEPSTIIIGFGLCGNGVVGLESGPHTLVFPKAHDCIAMVLGSQAAYAEEFAAEPGTYYLTRGWLESGDDPLTTYHRYVEEYGPARAERLIDMMYEAYRKLRIVAFTEEEMAVTRELAEPVARFCRDRWGMSYDEYLGDPRLIDKLLGADPGFQDPELLVIPPGTTVTQQMFLD